MQNMFNEEFEKMSTDEKLQNLYGLIDDLPATQLMGKFNSVIMPALGKAFVPELEKRNIDPEAVKADIQGWLETNYPLLEASKEPEDKMGALILRELDHALRDLLTKNGVTDKTEQEGALELFQKTVTEAILNEFGPQLMQHM
jgi:hypothetical protein